MEFSKEFSQKRSRKGRVLPVSYFGSCFVVGCFLWLLPVTSTAQEIQEPVPLIAPEASASGNLEDRPLAPVVTPQNIINRIIIEGAQRIDERTILELLNFKPGDAYDSRLADDAVKGLFATGLFSNIAINRNGNDVLVKVQENPVINQVAFEGNERIDSAILQTEVALTQRTVYSRNKVQTATQRILDIYRRRGRYATKVEPQIIWREQNRIDLVFEIDEGPLSKNKKIFFNGNKFFSDSDLKDVVSSREYNRFNFLAVSDTYDPDRVDFDKQLLQRHYLRYGFIDYRLASAVGELLEDRSGFYITFALQEGERYRIGDISVTSEIPEIAKADVLREIDLSSGAWYDQDIIDRVRAGLGDYLGGAGYPFTNIGLTLNRRARTNESEGESEAESEAEAESESGAAVVDLHFDIRQSAQAYVERIDIRGNVRTVDSVIRREFDLVESDPYNSDKIRVARRRLERLGYFSKVSIGERQGSAPDKAVIEVDVEEKSTGSLNFGVGYSTLDGALLAISLKESNLLGRAHEVEISFTDTKRTNEFSIEYSRPYFLDYNVRAGFEIFNSEEEQEASTFSTRQTGVRLKAFYPLAAYLSQSVFYEISQQQRESSITTGTGMGAMTTRTTTKGTLSAVGQTISYDTRNSLYMPTQGYYVTLSNILSGLGGDFHYLRSVLRSAYYTPIGRSDWTWLIGGEAGNIFNWKGDDVVRGDRFFLGGNNLRGFRSFGAGSRSSAGGIALGGTNIATATTEFRRPILPESFGATASIFSDIGWVGGIENDAAVYPDIVKDSAVRITAGVGTSIITPIGPMRFDFAWPVNEKNYDRDKVFLFSFRSRF